MKRRYLIGALFGAFFQPGVAHAQMSQRARQIKDRQACEQDLPACKPGIRRQLEAERNRERLGLGALAGVLVTCVVVLYFRVKR